MLKLLGCLCVLAASSGMAYTCVLGLKRELGMAEQLMELLTALEGELTYSRCPLPELLQHLSAHFKEPYRSLLIQAGSRMENNSEADIPALWKAVCGQSGIQAGLPGEAYGVLLRTGDVFAYTSLEASLQLLKLGREKLAHLIENRRREFSGRKKMYCCLCYMAGLFSMIILL